MPKFVKDETTKLLRIFCANLEVSRISFGLLLLAIHMYSVLRANETPKCFDACCDGGGPDFENHTL